LLTEFINPHETSIFHGFAGWRRRRLIIASGFSASRQFRLNEFHARRLKISGFNVWGIRIITRWRRVARIASQWLWEAF
jgi:hypothetical protein